MRSSLPLSVSLMITLAAACGGGGADDLVGDSITITPAPTFVTVGVTRQLAATISPAGVPFEPPELVWSSSDPATATVSATGEVLGVAPGDVTITATSHDDEGAIELHVYDLLSPTPGPTLALSNSVTCGLADDGRAICWGQNMYSATGHPPYNTQAPTPEPVVGDLAYTSIAVGGEFACGTTEAGATYCWGTDDDGVLGVGPNPPPPPLGSFLGRQPELVDTTEHFVTVTAGLGHACALNEDGAAFCWGGNLAGQLGRQGTDNCGPLLMARECARAPVATAEGWTFVAIEARGERTCGLTAERTFFCWGNLDVGEGGAGDLHPWTASVVGPYHRCALDDDGVAYCWGAQLSGQLGVTGEYADCSGLGLPVNHDCLVEPRAIEGGLRFASLSASEGVTCGVTLDGAGYCWGYNLSGQLGDGTTTAASTPTAVVGDHAFARVVTDGNHACGVTTAGAMYCWGYHGWGQLGDGNFDEDPHPTPVAVTGGFTFQ